MRSTLNVCIGDKMFLEDYLRETFKDGFKYGGDKAIKCCLYGVKINLDD